MGSELCDVGAGEEDGLGQDLKLDHACGVDHPPGSYHAAGATSQQLLSQGGRNVVSPDVGNSDRFFGASSGVSVSVNHTGEGADRNRALCRRVVSDFQKSLTGKKFFAALSIWGFAHTFDSD